MWSQPPFPVESPIILLNTQLWSIHCHTNLVFWGHCLKSQFILNELLHGFASFKALPLGDISPPHNDTPPLNSLICILPSDYGVFCNLILTLAFWFLFSGTCVLCNGYILCASSDFPGLVYFADPQSFPLPGADQLQFWNLWLLLPLLGSCETLHWTMQSLASQWLLGGLRWCILEVWGGHSPQSQFWPIENSRLCEHNRNFPSFFLLKPSPSKIEFPCQVYD